MLTPIPIFILFNDAFQNEPSGRILELSILHLAISEIAVLGTRHQIVINEVYLSQSIIVFNITLVFLPLSLS